MIDGGAAHYDAELVYCSGERPAWQEAPTPTTAAYVPFSSLLRMVTPVSLDKARQRAAKLDRADLIRRYRAAHVEGKRLVAYVMAGELIERGAPPSCWHEAQALDSASINQRADLTLADLAWLRRWHPEHASAVRYQRGKALLTGSEAVFLREAEFAFYGGKRPAWQLVGSMSMTLPQQWEAAYLRSTPIKREADATAILGERVRQALYDNLRTTRRTPTFSEADARASLARRYTLWRCSRMVKSESPTMIATRYQQLTGEPITRQTAAKQLDKVRAVLREKGGDFLGG